MSEKRYNKKVLFSGFKENAGEIFKESLFEIVFVLVVGVIGLALLVVFGIFTERFTTVENAIISESGFLGTWSFYIWAGIDAITIFALLFLVVGTIVKLIKHRKKSIDEGEFKASKFTKKEIKMIIGAMIFVLAANILLGYCACTDVRIATDDTLIKRSPLNPVGSTYSYSDVVSYEVLEDDGNVVFELKMDDNQKIRFGNSGISSYEFEDYEYALSVIDDKLKKSGAEKDVKCVRDQFYWYDEQDVELLDKLLSK